MDRAFYFHTIALQSQRPHSLLRLQPSDHFSEHALEAEEPSDKAGHRNQDSRNTQPLLKASKRIGDASEVHCVLSSGRTLPHQRTGLDTLEHRLQPRPQPEQANANPIDEVERRLQAARDELVIGHPGVDVADLERFKKAFELADVVARPVDAKMQTVDRLEADLVKSSTQVDQILFDAVGKPLNFFVLNILEILNMSPDVPALRDSKSVRILARLTLHFRIIVSSS